MGIEPGLLLQLLRIPSPTYYLASNGGGGEWLCSPSSHGKDGGRARPETRLPSLPARRRTGRQPPSNYEIPPATCSRPAFHLLNDVSATRLPLRHSLRSHRAHVAVRVRQPGCADTFRVRGTLDRHHGAGYSGQFQRFSCRASDVDDPHLPFRRHLRGHVNPCTVSCPDSNARSSRASTIRPTRVHCQQPSR